MKSRFALMALSLIFALASYAPAFAAENDADKVAPAAASEAEETTPEAPAAEEAIPAVPENGTLKDYQEYVSNLKSMLEKKIKSMVAQAQKDGVDPRSDDFSNSVKQMAKQFFTLIEQATDKALLIKDISEEELKELAVDKIQVIQSLAQINGEDDDAINAKMEAFVQQLRKMDRAELADVIERYIFNFFQKRITGYVQSGDVEAFTKIATEIDKQVEQAGKDINIKLAQKAAVIVIASANMPEYKTLEGLQDKYLKAFSEASDPEVQKLADALERAIVRSLGKKRFNEALGNEFKFGGTFTDGSEYKAEDYAGKVVLIDFWATWCGPCRAELPNVKKMYDAYHDKGFEVIGVTCDNPEAEESLNKFLKDNDIAWKQMFDDKAVVPDMKTKNGNSILVSEYYGINGIPCPVLIGADGKVISLNARGKILKEQLVKIYGEVEAKAEEAQPEKPAAEEAKAADKPEAVADALPAVPENGTLEEYQEYLKNVNDLLNKRAESMIDQAKNKGVDPQSEEFIDSLKNMANKYVGAMLKATEKALVLENVPDEDFEELVGGKIQLIQLSAQLNDENEDAVNAKMQEFADQLRKMDKAKIADDIETKLFANKVIGYAMGGDVKEFAKVAAEIDESVEKAGKDITLALGQKAVLICLVGTDLEGYEAPEGRINNYIKALKEASDPEVNKLAADLEELVLRAEAEKRFKEALGKEFKFGGTFTDGSEYKAEDYAGKVVLIDFWATWCGPCRAELPNVKKMYKAYHDKGFEVIGVTCDDPDEEEDLNKFLKDNDISWKQMFDVKAVVPGEKTKDGKPVLVSEYYGINAIPCPILIGADGKVLSLKARGKELKEQLVKIYGKVEGLDDVDEDAVDEEEEEFSEDEEEFNEDEEDIDDLDAEDAEDAEEAQPEEPAEEAQPEEPAAEDAKDAFPPEAEPVE